MSIGLITGTKQPIKKHYEPKFGRQDIINSIKCAQELGYPFECMERIKTAESQREVDSILTTYRHRG